MPNFGFDTIGDDGSIDMDGRYIACLGRPASAGTVDSITIYISDWGAGEKITCYLYNSSLNLIGTTEERTTGGGTGWYIFNFSAPKPSVVASGDYFIGAISDSTVTIGYENTALDGGNGGYRRENFVYGSPPNPIIAWDATNDAVSVSCYGTYTVSVAEATGSGEVIIDTDTGYDNDVYMDTASLDDNDVRLMTIDD